MNRFLLLSLMATAGVTAGAVTPVAETTEQSNIVLGSEQLQTMAPQVETISCETDQANGNTKAVIKAETTGKPYYNLPGGVFMESYGSGLGWTYFYYTTGSGKRYEYPVAVPAYKNLDWNYHKITNSAVPTNNIIWQYYSLNPSATGYSIATNQVQEATSITTPAYPFGYGGWGTPIMASVNGEDQTLYSFGDVEMSYSRPIMNSSTKGKMHMTYGRYNLNLTTKTVNTDTESDSLIISPYYTNYLTDWEKYGFYIPKPNGMYGIYGVNFMGVPFNYISEKFSFSVYKVASRKSSVWATYNTKHYQYELGEKIGEGYVSGDSLQTLSKLQVIFIPIKETIGEFEMDSYLNIDTDVVIMFDGYTQKLDANGALLNDGDKVIPDVLCTFNPYFENEVVYLDPANKKYKSGNSRRLNSVGFPTYLMSGVNLVLGNLAAYDEEDYYTFNAATAGESKTFEFEPSIDLNDEDGRAYIDGDGAFDWYEFTVNNIDETTGMQTITVKVNALPAGVNGRSSDLLVKVPGAEQVIKITQGEVSGIDSVANDAAVVSSTYFDLMGRELNVEPETGLFIRQDVKADGSKVATKVVK